MKRRRCCSCGRRAERSSGVEQFVAGPSAGGAVTEPSAVSIVMKSRLTWPDSRRVPSRTDDTRRSKAPTLQEKMALRERSDQMACRIARSPHTPGRSSLVHTSTRPAQDVAARADRLLSAGIPCLREMCPALRTSWAQLRGFRRPSSGEASMVAPGVDSGACWPHQWSCAKEGPRRTASASPDGRRSSVSSEWLRLVDSRVEGAPGASPVPDACQWGRVSGLGPGRHLSPVGRRVSTNPHQTHAHRESVRPPRSRLC